MTTAFRFAALLWGAACLLGISGVAVAQSSLGNSSNANIETTQYQDWKVRCLQASGTHKCEMTQLISNPSADTAIMRVIMGYPQQAKNTAVMVFALPLGTRLAPGLRISIDGGKPIRIPFQVCLRNGCRATLPLKPSLLSKFRNGVSAEVSLIGPRGKRIDLEISLMGFTAASKAIAP